MTIDSRYFPQNNAASSALVYGTTLESIGATALEVWYYDGGVWTQAFDGVNFTFDFGQREPIYTNATITLFSEQAEAIANTGNIITFARRTPLVNPVVFVDEEEFDGNAFEFAVDSLTMICQEIEGHYLDCSATQKDPTDPENWCKIYSCSSLDDALANQGAQFNLDLMADAGAWPWPLSVGAGGQGATDKYSAIASYVAAPSPQDDWGGYWYIGDTSSWSWDATTFQECSVTVSGTQVANIECNASVTGTSMPQDMWVPSEAFSVNIVATGYQGGTDANITLLLGAQANYEVWTGATYQGRKYVDIACSIQPAPGALDNEHQITLTVGDAAQGRQNTVVVPIGPVKDRWVNITLTEESSAEITQDGGNDAFLMTSKVTATVTDQKTGSVFAGTCTGTEIFVKNGITSFDNVAPSSIYDSPHFLYGSNTSQNITISSLAVSSTAVDHTVVSDAFLLNFTDYVDPDPNCVPPP